MTDAAMSSILDSNPGRTFDRSKVALVATRRAAAKAALFFTFCYGVSTGATAGVFKCADKDGVVTYSDTACHASERTPVKVWDKDPNSASALSLESNIEPSQRLSTVTAIMESLAIDARDCDWALKVTKEYSKCDRFTSQFRPGSRFEKARQAYAELLEDRVFAESHVVEMRTVMRLIQEAIDTAKLYAERR